MYKTIQPPCGRRKCIPPFGGWRHHLSPASGGTATRAYCRAAYEERPRGVLFFPLNRGKSGAARIGGGERSEPIRRMPVMPYDTESKSRNADFISIARRAIRNPRPERPSNLRTLRTFGAKPRQPSPLKGKRLTMICASLCSFKSCSLCTPKARPLLLDEIPL